MDAVVRNLEIIGEAARHVPENITEKHPEIPWKDMRDMRNLLSHEYFGVNTKIVWETIHRPASSCASIERALAVLDALTIAPSKHQRSRPLPVNFLTQKAVTDHQSSVMNTHQSVVAA